MKEKLKKEKIVIYITISIACFALIMVMFMQFKVIEQTDITEIENMRESELRVELANWREKNEELDERYQEIKSKTEEYRNKKESDEETAKLLENELAQLNQVLGKTDVEGEGIQIILTDKGGTQLSEDYVVKTITEENLLEVINELFAAGAEAISINDKRIVAMSYIVSVDGYLKVNGERILSPYVIKAIGNQTYLESAVFGKGGRVDKLTELGHEVTLEKSRRIKINKYTGTISSKYIIQGGK